MTLQVSYENIKFTASDVTDRILSAKITDNQSDDFLRMLLTNLKTNLGKILGKSYEV